MEIRKMELDDYDTVYSFWISTKGMGLNSLDDSRDGIGSFLKRNPGTCFIAREEDTLCGVILCGHDGRRGYIYHLAVAEHMRNRGIGRNLVDSALSALSDEGIVKTALVVFEKNTTGNAFWEAMGFTTRDDLVYRNRVITSSSLERIDT